MDEENKQDEKKDAKAVVLDFIKKHKRKLVVLGVGGTIAAVNLLDPSIAAPVMTTLTSLVAADGLYKIFGGSDDKKQETVKTEPAQTIANESSKQATLAPATINEVAETIGGESKVAETIGGESKVAGNMQGVNSEVNFHVNKNNDARHLITSVARKFRDGCKETGTAITDGCTWLANFASMGMVTEPELVMEV